jgi:fatty acid desaturase
MGAEVLHQVLADEKSAHMLITHPVPADPAGPSSSRERLLGHFVIFLIEGWNLFAINLARTPGEWWFWPVLAVWAGVLVGHALWVSQRRLTPRGCAR